MNNDGRRSFSRPPSGWCRWLPTRGVCQASCSQEAFRLPRTRAIVRILLAWAAGLAVAVPQPARAQKLRASPAADGKAVVIEVEPIRGRGPGLLEVVDESGRVVRTLHAGRFGRASSFPLRADAALQSGRYKVRYREGVSLQFDREIKRPGARDGKWFNPTDLAIVGRFLYVLDSGLVNHDGSMITGSVGTSSDEDAARLKEERSTCLYKLSPSDEADAAFGEDGRVALGRFPQYRGLTIDPDLGTIFMPLGSHEIHVLDPTGTKTGRWIGGWDDNPNGPKCTGWPNSLAISPVSNRIFIVTGYGHGKVYDRAKKGFEGIVSRFDLPRGSGMDRSIVVVGTAVYIATRGNQIERFDDDGGNILPKYASGTDLKLAFPTGLGAVPGLIWAACRGPGFGPYWDSGGGGEVVLFHDDGGSITLVERFGFPGIAAEGLEFLNPSAAVPSPDHTELYVVEDGMPNSEGPAGNARIRRFKITATAAKEIVVVL